MALLRMGSHVKKYNHAYTVAFSIDTDLEADAPTDNTEVVPALLRRIADLVENDEMDEHLGMPFDTYERHL